MKASQETTATTEPMLGWDAWVGCEVVVDMRSPYVALGVLRGQRGQYLLLENADMHDLRDTNTNRERYVLDSRRFGIRVNRKELLIPLSEVAGLSRLEDVVVD